MAGWGKTGWCPLGIRTKGRRVCEGDTNQQTEERRAIKKSEARPERSRGAGREHDSCQAAFSARNGP
jgi:hypothetical protein